MATDVRLQAIHEARSWVGTPYHHQASTKGAGCDCLGLLRGVYRGVYGEEPEIAPPYSPNWNETGDTEPMLDAARRHLDEIDPASAGPGDVPVFRVRPRAVAKHCGIVVQGGNMIHAHSNQSVVEVNLGKSWQRKIAGAFRFRPV